MTLTILIPCMGCDALVVVDGYRCFAPRPICAACATKKRRARTPRRVERFQQRMGAK